MRAFLSLPLIFACLYCAAAGRDDTALVAVASNFHVTANALAEGFEARYDYRLRISPGSTGKLYAQVINGAPYDLFLAADVERPARLEAAGTAVAGTRRTYAVGRLLLWFSDPATAGRDCESLLDATPDGRLAIANPELAPYGRAAREFLVNTGRWETYRDRLVLGESIAQAFQFVATGNAMAGLVAATQARGAVTPGGCSVLLAASTHEPIEQQLVLLEHGRDNGAARAFLDYLRTPAARAVIRAHGYEIPPSPGH